MQRNPLVIKYHAVLSGFHVHVRFWAGPKGQTLASLGTLIMRVGEFQLVGLGYLGEKEENVLNGPVNRKAGADLSIGCRESVEGLSEDKGRSTGYLPPRKWPTYTGT